MLLLLRAAVVGAVVGVLTQVLQGALPDWALPLANSGAVWTLAAYAVAAWTGPRLVPAVAAAVVTLVLAVIGYYVAADVDGYGVDPSMVVLWSVTGVLAGAIFGTGAVWWRSARPSWRRPVGVALPAALLAGEGVRALLWVDVGWISWLFVAAGLLTPFVLLRSTRDRLTALAVAAGFVAVALGAFWLLDIVIANR